MSVAPKKPRPVAAPLPFNARMRSSDLADVSFPQLLVELYETRETGTLLIQARREHDGEPLRAAVCVSDGEPVAVIAENCNARGVRPVLVALCGIGTGRFEFVEFHDLVGDRGARAADPVDPLEVVAGALRGPACRALVGRVVSAIGANLLRLHSGTDLARYAFNEQERRVGDALAAGPLDLRQLSAKAGLAEGIVLSVAATLLLTRAVTVLPAQRRTMSGTVRLDLPASVRRAVSARPSQTVSARPSPAETAQRESLPPLTDPTSQHKLLKATWSNIELMVQRRQYEEALQASLEALKAGEALPEHQALLGWIIYQHSGAGEQAHPKVWSLLDRALRRDPLCEKALYYKALVLKRTGRAEQACAHFERLLLINPKHIDAVREVRLHKMRSRRQSSGLRRLFPGTDDD